jgi:putative nucleotidyltransferase with HDIG domain
MLAAAAGFEGRDLVWIRMGAFLHDVGKTEVPAEVLNKPGKLTADEWEMMRSHTTAGDAIVAGLDFPWDIRPIVRNHHERYDGSGYPDGLCGEDIPFAARVLCVADIYDALTTTRSYRPAYTPAEALDVMRAEAGSVLDPKLFELFASVIRSLPADSPYSVHRESTADISVSSA